MVLRGEDLRGEIPKTEAGTTTRTTGGTTRAAEEAAEAALRVMGICRCTESAGPSVQRMSFPFFMNTVSFPPAEVAVMSGFFTSPSRWMRALASSS